MFANRDFLPRYARLRNDEHLGMKEKKKGKNCSAIFPFLFNPSKPRHAERNEASHHCALCIVNCALKSHFPKHSNKFFTAFSASPFASSSSCTNLEPMIAPLAFACADSSVCLFEMPKPIISGLRRFIA